MNSMDPTGIDRGSILVPQPILSLFFVAGVSFVVAVILTPVVARLAVSWGWMDRPDGRRKLHRRPVPAVGGVAVVMGFSVAAGLLRWLDDPLFPDLTLFYGLWEPLLVAALGVSIIGLVDDARGIGPLAKLTAQAAAGLYLYYRGFQVSQISNPFGEAIHLGMLALPVTLLWLVGMSNAFNLIDGMDGLAAGIALVATVGLQAAAAVSGRWEVVLVAGALAGALVGFLPYNFNPARVFLGDCGSLPVGFILAAIALKGSVKASAAVAVAVPLLALALPILDVGLAVVRRFMRRKRIFQGDHDHIHHRLVDMGLTPRRAVVTLYGVAVLFTGLALAVAMGPGQVVWAAVAIVVLVIWLGVRALGYWEVTEFQKTLLNRLVAGLWTPGDAALRGAERDISRMGSIGAGWERLCAVAWALGVTELQLTPMPAYQARCPEFHSFAPTPLGPQLPAGKPGAPEDRWSMTIQCDGEAVADMTARRPLSRMEFDPGTFAAIVQQMLKRHLTSGRAN
jgi:UDP-GlcNAc:undecaprenyl-phosphate/decaprenyl-phosphate GlcNAc-1-phosphate transferase